MGAVISLHTREVVQTDDVDEVEEPEMPPVEAEIRRRLQPDGRMEPVDLEDIADLGVLVRELGNVETWGEQKPILARIRRLIGTWPDG